MIYKPPKSVVELLLRYASGERTFSDVNLDNEDLSGVNLEGIVFRRCYLTAIFRGACLKDAVFEECNVKSADFREADLRDASFSGSSICAIMLEKADLTGVSFDGARYHSHTMQEDEILPK